MSRVIEHRRWLHQNAELSFEEYKTQAYICEQLDLLGVKYVKVAGTGVLAELGDNKENTILLRADIDALPIEEKVDVEFKSQNVGVMHACGHDMHAAALLGAVEMLVENPVEGRTVLCLFQPGEEMHPGGASMVLKEGVLDGYNIVAAVGQHCSPEIAVGDFGLKVGEFMASTDELHIRVKGKGGHAAQPALLRNPIWAAVDLLGEYHRVAPADESIPHVLAFGRIEADGATNIIPDEVYIEGTFRTFSEEWRADCKGVLREIAYRVGEEHNLEVDLEIKDGYPSVYNNEELASEAVEIMAKYALESRVIEIPQRMTAEDFGFYGERYRSLFLRIGVGVEGVEAMRLHTSGFCPSEGSLELGSEMLYLMAHHLAKN